MDDLSRNSDFVRKLQDTTSGPLAAALREYADAQNTTFTLLDVASSAGELNTGSVNTVKDAADVVRKVLK